MRPSHAGTRLLNQPRMPGPCAATITPHAPRIGSR